MEFGLKGINLGIYTHSFVERSHVWIRPDVRSCKTALLPESTCWRSHLTNHLPVNEEFNTTRCPFEAVNMKTGSIVVRVINSASIIIRLLLRQYIFKCSFFLSTSPSEWYSSGSDLRPDPSGGSTEPFAYQRANHRTRNLHCLGSPKYQFRLNEARYRRNCPLATSK